MFQTDLFISLNFLPSIYNTCGIQREFLNFLPNYWNPVFVKAHLHSPFMQAFYALRCVFPVWQLSFTCECWDSRRWRTPCCRRRRCEAFHPCEFSYDVSANSDDQKLYRKRNTATSSSGDGSVVAYNKDKRSSVNDVTHCGRFSNPILHCHELFRPSKRH